MGTLGEISAAINLIQVKKETLRKSLLRLQSQSQSQSQSPSSFNFTLKWTDFDSYFTTLTSSIHHRFHLLQTLHPSSDTTSLLKSFCHNSDGLGLRRFIINAPDRPSVSAQLPDAYRCAPDAAAMVLDAMTGFYTHNSPRGKVTEHRLVKSACVIMLEGLMHVKPDVTVELRDKAMKVAVQWNRKRANSPVRGKKDNALGFLLLVGAYGLIDGFSMDDLIDCFVLVARRRQTLDLCIKMIPADNIKDLIQELINKDMQVAAVKFSIEFQKTDEFPPVVLLAERKLMSERTMEEIHKNGKNRQVCNEVMVKEVNALRSIIKCIDEYHLESEYPKDAVVALLKKVEDEMGSRKRAPVGKKQLSMPKKRKPNNFLEAGESGEHNLITPQQPHSWAVVAEHVGEYHSSPAGFTPIGPYGLTGTGEKIGYGGNPMAGGSGFYLPPSGYHSNWNELASYYPH